MMLIHTLFVSGFLIIYMAQNNFPGNDNRVPTIFRLIVLGIIIIGISKACIGDNNDRPESKSNAPVLSSNGEHYFDANAVEVKSEPIKKIKEQPINPNIRYKILFTHNNIRADRQPYFLVLIDPVNMNSDTFKSAVRQVIAIIVKRAGRKINIDVFDSKEVLEMFNKSDEINITSGRKLTSYEYNTLVGRHNIATYVGFPNDYENTCTIDFFPSGDNSKVSQYRGSEEL